MAATPLCSASPPSQLQLPASAPPITKLVVDKTVASVAAADGGPTTPTVSSTPSIGHRSDAPSSCPDDELRRDASSTKRSSMAVEQQQHNDLMGPNSLELQQQQQPLLSPAIDLPHLFLICGLCRDYFRDEPKLLSCLHTFCAPCLQASMPTGSLSVSCSACKAQTIVPAAGISGFQTNFYAVALKKILRDSPVCGSCRGEVAAAAPHPVDTAAASSALSPSSSTPASYRCTECAESLCSICAKTHALKVSENRETGESKSHDAVSLCRLAIKEVANVAVNAGFADGNAAASSLASTHLHDEESEKPSTRMTSEVLDASDVAFDLPTLVEEEVDEDGLEDHHHQRQQTHRKPQPDPHYDHNHHPNEDQAQLICPSHDYRQLDLFCLTCETGICHLCAERSHFEHDVEMLVDAIDKERTALEKMAEDVEAKVPLVEQSILQVNHMKESLHENWNAAESQINSTFDSLVASLVDRRDRLLKEAAAVHQSKQQTLKRQRDALEGKLAKMLSCAELTLYTLEKGGEAEILLLHKQLSETMEELASLDVAFTPQENDFLAFDEGDLPKMRAKVAKAGCILSNSCVAHETVATGEGLRQCVKGKVSVVGVTTKNHDGELVTTGNAQFETYLQHTSSGKRTSPEVCDNRNGNYELGYLLNEPGNYIFVIKLYGHHIKGSPFKLRCLSSSSSVGDFTKESVIGARNRSSSSSSSPVKSAVRQRAVRRPLSATFLDQRKSLISDAVEDDLVLRVGARGRGNKAAEFTNPQGLCVLGNGRIVVADANNQSVQIFANGGKDYKLKFGVRGRQPGQFQRPVDVAVTLHQNLLVSDADNKWISIHGSDGKYLNRIGVGKLVSPKGIAVDSNGHVIVVDNKACAVFVFQSNGKLLLKFGERGQAEHQLSSPQFVAVNSSLNQVLVTDYHDHRVKVFDSSNGAFLFAFGSRGEGNGQFHAPTGVAVDAKANVVVVADWGNSRIQVFDDKGSFLSFVNTEADPLYGPQGLAITNDGHLVVADAGNHCFKVYRYLQ